jgi:eukaryotic-like serine/threonine-protein kinase
VPDRSPNSVPTVGPSSVEILDRNVDVPPAQLSDFEVLRVLASNGGISTCVAKRLGSFGFNKRVLLKVADATFDESPETNTRLNEEARIGMRLGHPNLIQILDLGRDEDRTFLVREWVDGLGLRGLLRRTWDEGHSLSVPAVLRIGEGVARALGYLHNLRTPWAPRGISHRVVTPSNILLSRAGEVRVGNLSLADPSDVFDSEARAVKGGHPAFCAPEVLDGARASHPADIFSLGAVLFEALVGPGAFSGDIDSDWHRYRTDKNIQGRVQTADLPSPLRGLLAAATHPLPDSRPNAIQLREFLRGWLNAEHSSNGEDELQEAVGA